MVSYYIRYNSESTILWISPLVNSKDGVDEKDLTDQKSYLDLLSQIPREDLEQITMGIDRGVVRPVQAGEEVFDLTPGQKKNKSGKEKYLKRLQHRLSKQQKGSRRRGRTKKKIGRVHDQIANIRKDFCHQTSRKLVDKPDIKVYVFEDLRTTNMTKSAKGTEEQPGKNVKAKTGLNRAILDKGWHMLEAFTKYKAYRAGKVVFKIPASYTSQECAVCGHTHPDNRKSQEKFLCLDCGNTDNADNNAQKVIKKRCADIRKLGDEKKQAFYRRFIGVKLDVLIEDTRDSATGLLKGFSSNYVPVLIAGDDRLKNTVTAVQIDKIVDGRSMGTIRED